MRKSLLSGMLALVLAPHALLAQVATAGASAGFELYHFADPAKIGIENISLLTVPLAARVPIAGGAALDLSGAYARGSLKRADGTTTTLQGLTDTSLGISYAAVPGVLTITAVALLPTGKKKLTLEEAEVAGVVAADLLPFEISNWGSGGGAGGSAALAHSFGGFGLGASASYLLARRYDVIGTPSLGYRPGNQLRLRVALDAATGLTGKASLQLTYQHASDDQFSDSSLFRSGDRFQAIGSYSFAAGARSSGVLYAGVLRRAEGKYFLAAPVNAPTENLLLGGGGLRLPVSFGVLMPSADVRVLRRASGLDQGVIASVGTSAELGSRTSSVIVIPALRGRIGRSVVSEGNASGFSGIDVSLGIRFGGRRR